MLCYFSLSQNFFEQNTSGRQILRGNSCLGSEGYHAFYFLKDTVLLLVSIMLLDMEDSIVRNP